MKRDFEKYFPLPWHIEEDETGQLRTLCPASGKAFMDFGIIEGPLDFDGYDVQEYLVQCANLMPEAEELLKAAQNIMKGTCELCDGKACGRSGGCDVKGIGSRIGALLAKLEGGMEE